MKPGRKKRDSIVLNIPVDMEPFSTIGVYAAFLAVSALMNLVYIQMYTTLSVYLFDVHGVPANGYGYLMSMNAVIVVMYRGSG